MSTNMTIYSKVLAPRMEETQKSHSLLSTSWRPRKAGWGGVGGRGGYVVQRPESRRARGVHASSRLKAQAQVHWAGEDGCLAQQQGRGKAKSLLPPPFHVLFQASEDGGCPPTSGEPSTGLGLSIQMLISSGNTFTDTPRNNV